MWRGIRGIFALVSSAIFVAVAVLWIRSRHHVDLLVFRSPAGHAQGVAADHGGLLVVHSHLNFAGSVDTSGNEHSLAVISVAPNEFGPVRDVLLDPQSVLFSFARMKITGQNVATSQSTPRFTALSVPYWMLLAIWALLPIVAVRGRWRARHRVRAGLCVVCGYDLRASVDRCPECGTALAVAGPASAA